MRWVEHQVGDKRISSGFLWLPKTIGDETRWLEKATWEEECEGSFSLYCDWSSIKWLSD